MIGRWALLSARGGAGVSTVCANLARALARRGNSTLLVDMKPTAPAQDMLCGVSEQVIYAFTDVGNGVSVTDACISWEMTDALLREIHQDLNGLLTARVA